MLPRLVSDHTRSHHPEVVETLRAMILGNSADAVAGAITALMTRRDSLPLLPSIHCPTLIVVGKDDAITPPAFSEEMQRAISGSELAVLPDAGHMANMEQPAAFNDALGRFLQRHA